MVEIDVICTLYPENKTIIFLLQAKCRMFIKKTCDLIAQRVGIRLTELYLAYNRRSKPSMKLLIQKIETQRLPTKRARFCIDWNFCSIFRHFTYDSVRLYSTN